MSFGDLIIAVGLCDLTFHASRKRKPRASPAARTAATAEPREIDLANFAEPRHRTATTPAANAPFSRAELVLSPHRAFERAQHTLVVDVARRGPQRLERDVGRRAVDDRQLVVLAREPEHLHGEPAAMVVTFARDDVARAGERFDLAQHAARDRGNEMRLRTAGDLGIVERHLADVVQERRHLEVVEVVPCSDPSRSPIETASAATRSECPAGTNPPSSGAIASASIVCRYANVAESSRSKAYQAASNGVAKRIGPQMPTSPFAFDAAVSDRHQHARRRDGEPGQAAARREPERPMGCEPDQRVRDAPARRAAAPSAAKTHPICSLSLC